ncbi:NAD(P)/FAD-dependent oxidoreductase [Quadrisphaera sp. KR29]|uniref:NAD(P)/FAD-dependent oxidoreductase n=1 Tax=Quadrisphaera sp. KR29 TaxID=3461391 RepID=UPI004043E30C
MHAGATFPGWPGPAGAGRVADLAVVGGGPVGLAAALRAAGAGLDVVVVEPRARAAAPGAGGPGRVRLDPVDKACGEGLLPGALAEVLALGVDPAGAELTGVAYVRDGAAGGAGGGVGHDFSGGPGRGVRRTVLHAALAQRAAACGVPVLPGRVVDLVEDGARVRLDVVVPGPGPVLPLVARWVLGADGLHSAVRRAAGLDGPPVRRSAVRFGVRRHAGVAPWSSRVEVHWGRGVEGYVTPVGPREVGVALLGPRGASFEEGLAQLPGLADRLGGAPWTSAARGAGPLRQRVRAVGRGRVLLVGDAAGYVDALTGEGLRLGLASARLAVEAVTAHRARWVAGEYAAAWRAGTRAHRALTAGLLGASSSPVLRAGLLAAASASPRAFGAVVEQLAR